MADPFDAVRKLQQVQGGEAEQPGFQNAYGQKLQSLQDQLTAKKQFAATALGAAQSIMAAPKPAPYSGSTGGSRAPLAAGRDQIRALAQKKAAELGWTGAQWADLDRLIMKESGYNPTAQNPTSTAYGIGQFLNSTWKPYGEKTSDAGTQLDYMFRYLTSRYGDPSKALAFHVKNNWY